MCIRQETRQRAFRRVEKALVSPDQNEQGSMVYAIESSFGLGGSVLCRGGKEKESRKRRGRVSEEQSCFEKRKEERVKGKERETREGSVSVSLACCAGAAFCVSNCGWG